MLTADCRTRRVAALAIRARNGIITGFSIATNPYHRVNSSNSWAHTSIRAETPSRNSCTFDCSSSDSPIPSPILTLQRVITATGLLEFFKLYSGERSAARSINRQSDINILNEWWTGAV